MIPGSATPLLLTGAAEAGYQIDRSLRFNSADSAYLSRTPSSAGNRRTWTWSGWVKRGKLSVHSLHLFDTATSPEYTGAYFTGSDTIEFRGYTSSYNWRLTTTPVFRDTSSWYHIVFVFDSTNATSSDRLRLYINGVRITTFSTATYPSLNYESNYNNTVAHAVGAFSSGIAAFDGYLADIYSIDGQALDPTDFGEFDDNNVWQPKEFTGNYKLFDNSQTWSNNITTTGNSGTFHSSYPATNAFNNNDANYAHGNGDGSQTAVVTLTLSPGVSCSNTVSFLGGMTGSGTATISVNGGTAVNLTSGSSATTKTDVSFSGTVTSIVITKTSSDASGMLIYGFEIDGKRLVDNGASVSSNSFHLDFSDTSTAAGPGTDTSGNGNDWTVNNIGIFDPVLVTGGSYTTSTLYAGSGAANDSNFHDNDPNTGVGTDQNLNAFIKNNLGSSLHVASVVVGYGDSGIADGTWDARYINGAIVEGSNDDSAYTSIGTCTNTTSNQEFTVGTSYQYIRIRLPTNDYLGVGTFKIYQNLAGNDSVVDSPTNGTQTDTGAGGEVRGNYATWNPLTKTSAHTLSNGNLDVTTNNAGNLVATIFLSSGKWYWEVNSSAYVGITGMDGVGYTGSISGSGSDSYGYWSAGPIYSGVGGSLSGGASFSYSDTIGVALDIDGNNVKFYKNGVQQYSIALNYSNWEDLRSGVFPSINGGGTGTKQMRLNAGQRPFAYTAPSGYKALCTANLPDPTIADGSTAMDVVTYTGNGSTQTISGLDFSPDFVWIKQRTANPAVTSHILQDTVRGLNKTLFSDGTNSEITNNYLTSFNSDGFGVDGTTYYTTNGSGAAYVAWTWDAGSSTVTNTDGSITSTVRANPSAGFSVVSYSGTISGSPPSPLPTVGHGLGVAPQLVIGKSRDNGGIDTGNWFVWHASAGTGNWLRLNTTNAASNISGSGGGTMVAPTSTVFSTPYISGSNISGATYVAYCFAPVEGYSAFGSYTANGSADGPFVYTGFRPRWILLKSTGGTYFMIHDTARSTYNAAETALYPGLANGDTAEPNNKIDILSNGFKVRAAGGSNPNINPSSGTVVYAAFAEHPFASNARAR